MRNALLTKVLLNGRNDNIVANATLFLLKQYFTAVVIIKPPRKLQLRDLIFFSIGLTSWNLVQISKTRKKPWYTILLFLISI